MFSAGKRHVLKPERNYDDTKVEQVSLRDYLSAEELQTLADQVQSLRFPHLCSLQVLYRLAESQFLRMLAKFGGGGKGGSTITQIEYRVDPELERAFAKKQREYDKQCETRHIQ